MTALLLYEIQIGFRPDWTQLGVLRPGSGVGSITDVGLGGVRDVLLFFCTNSRSLILRSGGGSDTLVARGMLRVVRPTASFETLAELCEDGARYEKLVVSDRGVTYRARWTHKTKGV